MSAGVDTELATLLVRTLSSGRRARAVPDDGAGAAFYTNLDAVTVPSWAGGSPAVLTAALALQCAPSKEMAAELPWTSWKRTHRTALAWVEGRQAVHWAVSTWPGLGPTYDGHLSTAPVGSASCAGPADLLEQVLRLAGEVPSTPPPDLFGLLPLPRAGAAAAGRTDRSATAVGSRWSARRRARRHGPLPIPVSGPSGEAVTHAGAAGRIESLAGRDGHRLGLPYDEWDDVAQRYRKDYVRVVELPAPAPSGPAPRPLPVAALVRERTWLRGAEWGDVDIDAVIDWRCALATGEATDCPRVYRRLERRPTAGSVGLLIDASASASAGQGRGLQQAIATANSLAAGLGEQGHRVSAVCFRSRAHDRVEVQTLKSFADVYLPFGRHVVAAGYTRLGAAIRHAGASLLREATAARVLIVLSDGVPYDEGYDGAYARADVARAVDELGRRGVTVHLVAPRSPSDDSAQEMFGVAGWSVADSTDALPRVLERVATEVARAGAV